MKTEYFSNIKYHLIILIVGVIIYYPSLNAPFYLDDTNNILKNLSIEFEKLDVQEISDIGRTAINKNRIVSYITFGLSYLFHKHDPKGYRYFNICIHLVTALLLFELIQCTLKLTLHNLRITDRTLIAFLSSLLWMAHPIQTQAVTYIVQRMTSLATCFYILSLLLYVKARTDGSRGKRFFLFSGCFMAGTLSFGSKEIALTLPFFILLYEWFFIQDLSKSWLVTNTKYILAAIFSIIIVSIIYSQGNPIELIKEGYGTRSFTLIERLLTQPRVILFYISLIFFPHPDRLSLEHSFSVSTSLFSPATTFFSILMVLATIGWAIYFSKKYTLLSFIIFWFFGNLFIESSFIPLEMVFEHRLYLPTTMLFITLILLLYKYLNFRIAASIASLFIFICCYWTFERNTVWADPLLFHQQNVIHANDSFRAHNNYGKALIDNGYIKEGLDQFAQSIELNQLYYSAQYNLGLNLTKLGRVNQGIKHLRLATQIDPNSDDAFNNLGIAYGKNREFSKAIKSFEKALRLNPNNIQAENNLRMVRNIVTKPNLP